MKNTFILSLALLIFSQTVFSQKRAMTTDDGLNMINLRSAVISPEGEFILYSKSELDWDENKRKTSWHYLSPDGETTFKYIGKDGASDLKFSPDGKFISFKRSVDKKQQLFLMRTTGGEAIQLTEHKESVGSYQWTNDSKRIFFISDKPESKDEKEKKKKGYDHVYIDEGPNGQREGDWEQMFVIGLDDKKIKTLLKDDITIGSFDVAPDGKRVIYTARKENRRNQRNLSEIYLLDLNDSTKTKLTENKAPESNLRWAPDGEVFAFTANDDEEWELRNSKIWIMDPDQKNTRMISGNFTGSIRSDYYWTPDSKTILFSGLQKTITNVFSIDVESGSIKNISGKDQGTTRIMDLSKDRKLAILTYEDHKTPTDLYFSNVDDYDPKKITDLNPWIKEKIQLADASVITWKSFDGLEIEGILYLPEDHKQNKKFPFLLHIHGGPAGVFTDRFSYRYHVWAGLGYVQLAPNVRGSSGYSDEFLRGNMKDIGGGDYQDLMTGVDYLIEEKYIDPDKMAVRGWSYGGILGGTVITKTDRFKAASLGAMVSDWTSEYGIGFNYDVRLWYIGGTPWENPEGYRNKSALTHVENVNTPTLILHGARDRTDTEAQSMMFFAALKDLGKTVRYIRFPREPHGFREPRHQRTRDIEEIKWIQKYTLDKDWEPWKRKEEKEKDEKKEEEKDTSSSRN